jgi:hypothetical protein
VTDILLVKDKPNEVDCFPVFLVTAQWVALDKRKSSDPGGSAIYGSCHCFLNKYSLDKPLLCDQMSDIPNMHELIFPHDKTQSCDTKYSMTFHNQPALYCRELHTAPWASDKSIMGLI